MPKLVPGFAAGVSGESPVVAGRAESLTLGRVAILNPTVSFSQATKGAHSWADFDGFLGSEIWRRFRVTLDYSRKQMRLEPNDSLRDPFESDMSGLILVADGADFKTLRVGQVRSESPAAAAGLREGDVLLAVDAQSASMFTLFQLKQIFKQDGREVLLRVRRGEEQLQVRSRTSRDRKSTRLNSSHLGISYAVFCFTAQTLTPIAPFPYTTLFRSSESPAAAAGLREGDVLLAVDAQSTSMFTLFQLKQIFKQDGREVLLRVRRGEEQLQVRSRTS